MSQFKFRNYVPEAIKEKLRKMFMFPGSPGATHDAGYVAAVRSNIGPRAKGYRYPAPGSQPKANVPTTESREDVFNTTYYTRDTIRNQAPLIVGYHESIKPAEEYLPQEPPKEIEGSPGNKNPAVLAYDPTGTRTSMTTTWAAMNAELAKHQPNHLVAPSWFKEEDAIMASAEANGIPCPPGIPPKYKAPAQYTQFRW